MPQFQIQESFINETKGYRFGDSDWYDSGETNRGDLFRLLQREYGRCTSKIYCDTPKGVIALGWVFQSRQRYEDQPKETYTREVWVQVREVETEEEREEREEGQRYLDTLQNLV